MSTQKKYKGETILLVEDSTTQAEKLKFLLEEEGFIVLWASNAQEGFDFLKTQTPTIIISDVLMPGKDGFEFCLEVKRNASLSYIPLMLVTALSDPKDIIRGLECGADNFIIKPYKNDYFLSQLEYMIVNARMRQLSSLNASQMPDMGIEIFFSGKKHYIMSSQLQVLDLLFSTFDAYVQKNQELEEMNRQLAANNERIKALKGLIPICANCKKIRDDEGYWQQVDQYLQKHTEADFNASICPDCFEKEKTKENEK